MMWDAWVRGSHGAHQTGAQLAREPKPFPTQTTEALVESGFNDWRDRLTRNLARRSDGRWEPLTWVEGDTPSPAEAAP